MSEMQRIVLMPTAHWTQIQTTGHTQTAWKQIRIDLMKQDKPYFQRWQSRDGRCRISYVQDPLREVRYFHLHGEDLDTHGDIIRRGMSTFSRSQIEQMIALSDSNGENIFSIYHAAASVTNADPIVFDYLTRSLFHSDLDVRLTAVDATLLALLPDLRGPLEKVAATDENKNIREFASETIKTLERLAWNETSPDIDLLPLPPDPKRITPLTGVRDDWYFAAFGRRPNN